MSLSLRECNVSGQHSRRAIWNNGKNLEEDMIQFTVTAEKIYVINFHLNLMWKFT